MKYLWQVLVGYLLAVPLTDRVELNLLNTQWENILTYFWIAGAALVWGAIFWLVIVLTVVASQR